MSASRGSGSRQSGGAPSRARISGRFIAEFGIIFVGVFGAFIAEDIRQSREDAQRAQQTYEALRTEIAAFTERAPLVVGQMQSAIDEWQAALDRGETPLPPYYREPQAESPPTAIWQATLASGGVALLDPQLFNQLATYYNRLESVITRYQRYNGVTERDIFPYLDDPPSTFYADDGRLRGLYRTHVMLLDEIKTEIDRLTEEGKTVDAAVAAELAR